MNSTLRFSRAPRAYFVLAVLAMLTVWLPTLARADDASDKLVIVKATYGDLPSGKTADVTAKVAAMVKDNSLSVDATNENFDDPAQGSIKKLRVDYTVGGKPAAKVVNEHETLKIAAGEQAPVIVKARFGDLAAPGTGSVDVTEKVAAMIKEGERLIPATVANFTDPAANAPKQLRIEYTINGKPYTKTVDENVSLIVAPVVAQSGALIIQRARWGDGTPGAVEVDVTDLVAEHVKNGSLTVDATDAIFGVVGDPGDTTKKLEVTYTLNGVKGAKTVTEDETLTLPPRDGKSQP